MNFREMYLEIEGRQAVTPVVRPVPRMADRVAPNYFDTFSAPIVAGRAFSEADLAAGSNVAIVDQTFVNHDSQGAGRRRPPRARDARGRQGAGALDRDHRRRHRPDRRDEQEARRIPDLPAGRRRKRPRRSTSPCARATTRPRSCRGSSIIAGEVDPSARLTEMMTLDNVGEADLRGARLLRAPAGRHQHRRDDPRHRRRLRADVVHRGAPHGRNRHPRRARREPAPHRHVDVLARADPGDDRADPGQHSGRGAGRRGRTGSRAGDGTEVAIGPAPCRRCWSRS